MNINSSFTRYSILLLLLLRANMILIHAALMNKIKIKKSKDKEVLSQNKMLKHAPQYNSSDEMNVDKTNNSADLETEKITQNVSNFFGISCRTQTT